MPICYRQGQKHWAGLRFSWGQEAAEESEKSSLICAWSAGVCCGGLGGAGSTGSLQGARDRGCGGGQALALHPSPTPVSHLALCAPSSPPSQQRAEVCYQLGPPTWGPTSPRALGCHRHPHRTHPPLSRFPSCSGSASCPSRKPLLGSSLSFALPDPGLLPVCLPPSYV